MLKIMAISLLLTLALELGFALVWGLRGKRELTVAALVNVLTNPPVVLLYHVCTGLFGWPGLVVTPVLECGAVLVEWQCYRSCSEQLKRPFLFALLANILSFGVGLLINLL